MSEEMTGTAPDGHEIRISLGDPGEGAKAKAKAKANAAKKAAKRRSLWLAKLIGGSLIGGGLGLGLASIMVWPHPLMGAVPFAVMGVSIAFAGRDLRPRVGKFGDASLRIDWALLGANLTAIGIGVLVMLLLVTFGVHPIVATMLALPIMAIGLIVATTHDVGGELPGLADFSSAFQPDEGLKRYLPLGIFWGVLGGAFLGFLISGLWLEMMAVGGMVALRLALPKWLPELPGWGLVLANTGMFVATFALVITAGGFITIGVLMTCVAIGGTIGLTQAKS